MTKKYAMTKPEDLTPLKVYGVTGEEQEWNEITTAKLRDALRKTRKWKSPGIDEVPKLCLNVFESIHDNTTNCPNKAMTNPKLKLK